MCAGEGEGIFVGVDETMAAWETLNGCAGSRTEAELPDSADDGTRTVRVTANGCRAATELLRVEGGGHTWPSVEMWAFMAAHPAGTPAD